MNEKPTIITERVHVDSTSASAYASVSDEGLFQFGHSNDHRPDLPQVKVMQAVLDPLGMPLVTDVVSGERADDPLYIPCIERVQASLGRSGQPCKGELNNLFSSGVILRSKHVLALAFQSASGAASWVPAGFCETL